MTDNKFQGGRTALDLYDDAMSYTSEERETYRNMLANRSFALGSNIFDDKFWIQGDDGVEFVVNINTEPSNESLQKIIDNFIKEWDKANG